MTDEEKAKEYIKKNYAMFDMSEENLNLAIALFLDGLAEGRKELEQELGWITDTDNYIGAKLERCIELEKENAELQEQVDALEEELQAERYMLKCRDDELAEARAEAASAEESLNAVDDELDETRNRLELVDQQLRQAQTALKLAVKDFQEARPDLAVGYFEKLTERAKKQIELEDLCWQDEEEKIKMDVQENEKNGNN